MIKGDKFFNGFKKAMKQLEQKEEYILVYKKLWKTKM